MAAAMLLLAALPAAAAARPVTRLAGPDRFATAAEVARARFHSGAPVVYVASGRSPADSVPAAVAAAAAGGPVLLVEPGGIPPATAAELDRRPPPEIVIVGGSAAVAPEVEQELEERFGEVAEVRRLGGADRAATAGAVAIDAHPDGAEAVVVASGEAPVDALAVAPLAAREGAPLLLVAGDEVPPATADALDALAPERVLVVGGTAVMSEAVEEQLRTHTGADIRRIAGPDRIATALAVADEFDRADVVHVAGARAVPDALSAAAPAALDGSPVLLLPPEEAPPAEVVDAVRRLGATRLVVVGGPAALPEQRVDALATAALPAQPVVVWETGDGSFRTTGHDAGELQRIREGIARGEAVGVPNGAMRPGDGRVNIGHDWHVVDVEIADLTIELCDATVAYVDANLESWMDEVGRFCPWTAEPVEIEEVPEVGEDG